MRCEYETQRTLEHIVLTPSKFNGLERDILSHASTFQDYSSFRFKFVCNIQHLVPLPTPWHHLAQGYPPVAYQVVLQC